MYMTRDIGMTICLWCCEKNELYWMDYTWYTDFESDCLITINKHEFKKIFPKQKLPRKGSCKYVELRLYIPGEG